MEDGEEIVTNGVFVVDASAQLEGKRSMMNNDGAVAASGHANHGIQNHGATSLDKSHAHDMLNNVGGACGMCKDRIEKTAKGVAGVSSATWDDKTKQLHLNFDKSKTNLDVISKAIAAVGHDTEKHKADDAIYDALPGCCKYR